MLRPFGRVLRNDGGDFGVRRELFACKSEDLADAVQILEGAQDAGALSLDSVYCSSCSGDAVMADHETSCADKTGGSRHVRGSRVTMARFVIDGCIGGLLCDGRVVWVLELAENNAGKLAMSYRRLDDGSAGDWLAAVSYLQGGLSMIAHVVNIFPAMHCIFQRGDIAWTDGKMPHRSAPSLP